MISKTSGKIPMFTPKTLVIEPSQARHSFSKKINYAMCLYKETRMRHIVIHTVLVDKVVHNYKHYRYQLGSRSYSEET